MATNRVNSSALLPISTGTRAVMPRPERRPSAAPGSRCGSGHRTGEHVRRRYATYSGRRCSRSAGRSRRHRAAAAGSAQPTLGGVVEADPLGGRHGSACAWHGPLCRIAARNSPVGLRSDEVVAHRHRAGRLPGDGHLAPGRRRRRRCCRAPSAARPAGRPGRSCRCRRRAVSAGCARKPSAPSR